MAVSGWYKLEQSFKALDIPSTESQVIYQIIAAIIHLSSAGVQKGKTVVYQYTCSWVEA